EWDHRRKAVPSTSVAVLQDDAPAVADRLSPHVRVGTTEEEKQMTRRLEADVCVVGAGLSGLTAARRMRQGGLEVVVVEARNRVGGRVWTKPARTGIPIDMGATFVAPRHDQLHALAKELGVETCPTYSDGDSILASGS